MKHFFIILLLVTNCYASRKITLGFEFGNLSARGIPSADGFSIQVAGGGFNDGTYARSGSYSRNFSLQNGNLQQDLISASIVAPLYLRVYYHVDAGDNTPSQLIPLVSIVESGASNYVGLGLTKTRRLALVVNGAYTDSSTNAVSSAGGWYLVEISSTWQASGNTHTMVINNSQTLTNSSNLAGLVSSSVNLWFGNFTANTTTMNGYFDDVALNDGSGNYENTFPDDTAHVIFMPVIKDTSIGDWTGGAGATTNLFEALNNVPPAGVSTDADATNIKNVASSATSNYDGATLSYNAFGIPPRNGIRVIVPVTRHGEHSATGTISGALKLVSNPPDSGEATFTFGDDAGAHGNDNITGTMKWTTKYGTPVYGAFADQIINRDARPIVRVGKRTASTNQACVDLLGLVIEHGTPNPRLRRHHF